MTVKVARSGKRHPRGGKSNVFLIFFTAPPAFSLIGKQAMEEIMQITIIRKLGFN